MNTVMRALVVAEEIADRHGDLDWFKHQYTLLRECNGILDSIEQALKAQNLWEAFEARG